MFFKPFGKQTVSVIVPIHNSAKYLPACLDSLMAQTYSDLQIILVDDGSEDDSLDICRSYAERDNRITVIHQVCSGVSSARNAGMDAANGVFIGFMDSDDTADPFMYEKMVCALQMHEECDIACCRHVTEGRTVFTAGYPNDSILSGRAALKNSIRGGRDSISGYVWSKLFRSSFLNALHLRFDPAISICEDLLFVCTAFKSCGKTVTLSDPLYHYSIRNDSQMGAVNSGRLTEFDAREMLLELVSGDKELSGICSFVYVQQALLLSQRFVVSGNSEAADLLKGKVRKYCRKALTCRDVSLKNRAKLGFKICFPVLLRVYIRHSDRGK